ncbi:MAG: hypothetical protein KBT34_10550 [Prevotella sp.]|nr:hypothetical protein [Candidatus Prevotella equi]
MDKTEKYITLLEKHCALQEKHHELYKSFNQYKRNHVASIDVSDKTIATLREQLDRLKEQAASKEVVRTSIHFPVYETQKYGAISDVKQVQNYIDNCESQIDILTKENADLKVQNDKLNQASVTGNDPDTSGLVKELKSKVRSLTMADHAHKRVMEYIKRTTDIKIPSPVEISKFLSNEGRKDNNSQTEEIKDIKTQDLQEMESTETNNEPMTPKYDGNPIEYNLKKFKECPYGVMSTAKNVAFVGRGYCVKRCPYFEHNDQDQSIIWCNKQ